MGVAMTEVADVIEVWYYEGIIADGPTDITNSVLFAESRFTSLMAAAPGSFEMKVRDPDNTLNFVTGHDLQLRINGEFAWGGIVWVVTKTNMFEAVDTNEPVNTRLWVLSGTDYNVIFDKRVLRNPAHYVPNPATGSGGIIYSPATSSGSIAVIAPITDGEVIRDHIRFYFDLSGYDTENTDNIFDSYTYEKGFTWPTQGTKFREVMNSIVNHEGITEDTMLSIYWMDGERNLHYIKEQDLAIAWGFSDTPDNSTTFPFRAGSGTENAMSLVNDALVWGGTNWTTTGDIVFAREQDGTSIADHHRWQIAEMDVGNPNFVQQAQVDTRAYDIIYGAEGTFLGTNLGRGVAEKTFTCTWLSARVPGRLIPNQVVPITLSVFGDEPLDLPLRSLTISWPGSVGTENRAWTQYEGEFGLLMSDPSWFWRYLQKIRPGKIIRQVTATCNNLTSKPAYGSIYSDSPATQEVSGETLTVVPDDPNGTKTLFHIPFMYVGGTMRVFVNGILQYRGIDFAETSPHAGTFTIFEAPASDDELLVICTVAGWPTT